MKNPLLDHMLLCNVILNCELASMALPPPPPQQPPPTPTPCRPSSSAMFGRKRYINVCNAPMSTVYITVGDCLCTVCLFANVCVTFAYIQRQSSLYCLGTVCACVFTVCKQSNANVGQTFKKHLISGWVGRFILLLQADY